MRADVDEAALGREPQQNVHGVLLAQSGQLREHMYDAAAQVRGDVDDVGRVLREPDAFPASDVGLLRAMTAGGSRPTPDELLARARTWRPWRAYAAQHLWMSDTDAK